VSGINLLFIEVMTYKLTQLKAGEKGRIIDMTVSNQRLQELGIIKGAVITVVTNNLICMVCNTKVCLGKPVTDNIIVEKI
jgi:Fe2+ transport system protein FeoA